MHNKPTFLLSKAKKLERKYKWLKAKILYEKALELAKDRNDDSDIAELSECIGYCLFRGALQAENREQFERFMERSIESYERMLKILRIGSEANISHARAMVKYTSSWIEHDLSRMEELLDEWWTYENKAFLAYQENQDQHAVGKIANNLMEYSVDRRFFFKKNKYQKRRKELIDIGEKAIAALSKTNDRYELARAYCWTAWYYGIGSGITNLETKGNLFYEKWLDYSKKAVALSEEVEDGWLIGWSYNTKSNTSAYQHNFATLLKDSHNVIAQGKMIKDNYMMLTGKWHVGRILNFAAGIEENPDRKRKKLTEAVELTREAIIHAEIINAPICMLLSQLCYSLSLVNLASLTTDLKEKRKLIEEAIDVGRKGMKIAKGRAWTHTVFPMIALSNALLLLSKIEKNKQERKQKLEETLKVREEAYAFVIALSDSRKPMAPAPNFVWGTYQIALTKSEIAKIEINPDKKIALFNEAVLMWKECLKLSERMEKVFPDTSEWVASHGFHYYDFGKVLTQIYSLDKKKSRIRKAIEVYEKAIERFDKFKLKIHVAESYWKIALNYNILGEHLKASQNYLLAAKEYTATIKRIPQLRNFCENFSNYMLAWSEIEKARYSHSIEEYNQAKKHYNKSAKLHQSTEPWSYLATNYLAWAKVEEAEGLSRKERAQKAKQAFQEALEQFSKAELSIKSKIGEITVAEEKELTLRLLEASDNRRKFCQARILLEDAKLLDMTGKYLQSSKKYEEAARKIQSIAEKVELEAERREMKYLEILCRAWEKMAVAEETTSSGSYLESAELFEQAKDHCYTKKASLWALGNSNFCRGLAAGVKYKTRLNPADHVEAKGYLKSASINYLQAGFENAAEYARATQRLFDAYLLMNQAEGEIDQEKRLKEYQLAENLLQLAAESFIKAKQPEKTTLVQQMLKNVREEKELAISFNEVLQAPAIASSTSSFSAPTSSSENSVGLEQFEHANVQANLIAGLTEVKVGESFCLTVEFVNAGKEPALLTRVEDFVPPDFIVVKKPEIYRLEDNCLNMKGKQIAPLKLVEAKLVLQPSKKGIYQLNPRVHYLDERGQNKSLQLKTIEIKVEEVTLADRTSTGTKELDSLLLGGIPKEYAVVLTGPPSDERTALTRNFLKGGTKEDETVFYVTTEADALKNLLKNPNFHLFLCNPKPKTKVPKLPNVTKLRSKTDLTNLNISLLKAYRNTDPSKKKRICIETVSNVLLNYEAKATCRWVSELTTDLVSKGFTVLAVMNPSMHPPDQAQAVLDLFDGEISLTQTEDPLECKKSLRIKKLRNQEYIKNPICLTNPTKS